MAVSAIAKVIMTLFKKHGIARGASMAQKLGFKNKDIKAAYKNLNMGKAPYKKGGTFEQRKGLRELQARNADIERRFGGLANYQMDQGGDISRATIMKILLEGGKVSPKMSRGAIRDLPLNYRTHRGDFGEY